MCERLKWFVFPSTHFHFWQFFVIILILSNHNMHTYTLQHRQYIKCSIAKIQESISRLPYFRSELKPFRFKYTQKQCISLCSKPVISDIDVSKQDNLINFNMTFKILNISKVTPGVESLKNQNIVFQQTNCYTFQQTMTKRPGKLLIVTINNLN